MLLSFNTSKTLLYFLSYFIFFFAAKNPSEKRTGVVFFSADHQRNQLFSLAVSIRLKNDQAIIQCC